MRRAWVLALLLVTGCAAVPTDQTAFPALLPLDDLLADAEAFQADPGPAQARRAARLRAEVSALLP